MHPDLPLQALQPAGEIHDLSDRLVLGVELAELSGLRVALVGRLEDAGQGDVLAHHRRGHRLGDPVGDAERQAEDAGAVLDGRLGLDRAVGDDLRHPVRAVLVGGVLDHLAAPTLVEVDVDVGHRDPLRVQEALEDQAVLQRIKLGDAQRPRDDRSRGRPATRSHPDADGLGMPHQVGHHQEIAGEAHLRDHLQLVGGLGAVPVGHWAWSEPGGQPALHLLHQPGLLRLPGRHAEARHQAAFLREVDVAALRDHHRVAQRFRNVAPHPLHLGGGFHVEVLRVEPEPLGVIEIRLRPDAQERVVHRSVLGPHVVQVVGGDQGQVQFLGDPQQVVAELALDRDAVVHQFAVVVARAEDVAHVGRGRQRPVVVAGLQPPVDLAGRAAGCPDQPGAVLLQQLSVEARVPVVALDAGQAGQPEEVVQPRGVSGPQGHVGVGELAPPLADVTGALVVPATEVDRPLGGPSLGREVALHADDRLQARGLGPVGEVERAVEVAVVGHGDGGLAQLGRGREKVPQPCGTVEHRVLGVHVEVGELGTHDSSSTHERPCAGHPARGGPITGEVASCRLEPTA